MAGRRSPSFDPRVTGFTIEDLVEEAHEDGDDPYNLVYYTTYSDIYHTNPECPHIAESERLHYATFISNIDGWPLVMGGDRFADELDECSWCEDSEPTGRFREVADVGGDSDV